MTVAKGCKPMYCGRVPWGGERVDLGYPTHGAAECRAVGRGVEAHACCRRAGHEEDQLVHVCYCGLAWSGDGPDDAGGEEAVGIVAGQRGVGTDTAPEGTSRLGEVSMVREDCWREVQRLFYCERRSKREIAEALGLDRKTVRRLLRAEAWRPYARAAQAATLLTPYAEQVRTRAPEVGYSARMVFQELRQQGYGGSYETIKRFVRPLRTAEQAAARATVRFETPPGQQSQIDWGQAHVYFRSQPVTLHVFILTLGYSRRSFHEPCVGETLGQFLDAHERAFEYFGGHTREHLYDRPRTVCRPSGEKGRVLWNTTFKQFADYWGFEPRVCQAYRAQTKGKVESGVKYFKGNFLPGRTFIDDQDLLEQVRQWEAEVADVRVHGTTHERPVDRFARERAHLMTTAGHPGFRLEIRQPRRVPEDYLVSFETNRYSVPFTLIGQTVEVLRHDGRLAICHRGQLVAEHDELAGKYQVRILPEHGPGASARTARRPRPGGAVPRRRPTPDLDVEIRDLAVYETLGRAEVLR
jgi:transposase